MHNRALSYLGSLFVAQCYYGKMLSNCGDIKYCVVLYVLLSFPSSPSYRKLNAELQPEGCTCFLRVYSQWCLPLNGSLVPTIADYNTVCHWLDTGIVVLTPVTLTLREKKWASADRELCPGPLSLYSPLPLLHALRGLQFHKGPPSNHRRTPQLFVSFWTPKIQPLSHPLSSPQPSSHSLCSHVSHLKLRRKYGCK